MGGARENVIAIAVGTEPGRGPKRDEIVAGVSAAAAGVPTTGLAIERTRPHGGEMPTAEAVHGAL